MLPGPRRLALPDALPAPAVQAGRLDDADRVRAALDVEGQARRADDAVRRVAHEVLPPRHVEPRLEHLEEEVRALGVDGRRKGVNARVGRAVA